jgi:hypothetical protein
MRRRQTDSMYFTKEEIAIALYLAAKADLGRTKSNVTDETTEVDALILKCRAFRENNELTRWTIR